VDIINNRYRVVNNLKQNRLCSVYEAIDIQKGFSTVKLYILNSKHVPKEFIDFCTVNFESLGSLNNPYMIEVLEFGIVKQIDNKKSYYRTYYYTTEFIEESEKLLNSTHIIKDINLLYYFINICKATNYFWISGEPYNELNIDNIYIKNKDFNIKLKDIITTELEKSQFSSEVELINLFNAPEYIRGESLSLSAQIYSLGVILIVLALKSKGLYKDNRQIIEIISNFQSCSCNEYKEVFTKKLYTIILKMIDFQPENRYKNIEEIIFSINSIYGTNYKVYDKNELEKLNFDIRIIGREEEISSILSIKDSIFKYDSSKKVTTVHGEVGIGKTRLLKHIQYILSLKEDYVLSSFDNVKINNQYSNKPLVDILKQMVPLANKELINKYAQELVKFLPEIADKKNVVTVNPLKGNKEKYKIISKIASFIGEFFADKQGIIIIDDVDKADEFTIDFFLYVISKYNKVSKIMILLSYRDGECLENKKFIEFLQKVRDNVKLEFLLKPLSSDQIGLMLKQVLNTGEISTKFPEDIYSHTKGNPLFIEETIKDIFARKMIYIKEDQGKWYRVDDDNFFLPQNMYEAYKNQVDKLDFVSWEILSTIAIFENPASIEVMREFISEDVQKISAIIDNLIIKGLLCRKIEDRGFVYDFYNRFLKAYIYETIEKEEKKKKHRLASEILGKYYEENNNGFISELIYHLEKSEQHNKLLYYYMENAEIMITLKNREEAIRNLSKAARLLEEENLIYEGHCSTNKLNLLLKIGDLYLEDGNRNEALKYYGKGEKIAGEYKLLKQQIDIIFRILDIIISTSNKDRVNSYIEKARYLLEHIDYKEGQLSYLKILCQRYFSEQSYDDVYKACMEGISLCDEEHLNHKVIFNTFLCNLLIVNSETHEALKSIKRCLQQCYDTNYTNGIVRCVNNLGVIYSDYLQDNQQALTYFKQVYELSREDNDIYNEIIALSNIGFTHYMLQQYNTAYNYFIKAINKAKQYDYSNMIFYDYTYLASIYYKFGNYGEAYRYYTLCSEQLEKWPSQGQEVVPYYLLAFKINFSFGDKEKASSYIEKARKIYEYSDSILKWELEVLSLFNEFLIKEDYSLDISQRVIDISKNITNINEKLSILYESAIILNDTNHIKEAKTIHEYIEKENFNSDSSRIICNKIYMESTLYNKLNIEGLTKAIELCKKYEQAQILWRIYSEIGNYYFNDKEYSYAATYYFEACGLASDLVLQVPKEYRVNFINNNNMTKPFLRFMDIENYFESGKLFSKINASSISLTNEGDIEVLFNYLNNNKILKNKSFIKSLKKLWSFSSGEDIQGIEGLVNRLGYNNINNMELIVQYISHTTLAAKASIIIEKDKKFEVLVSSNKDNELPKDLSIIQRCGDSLKPIVSKENFLEGLNLKSCKISSSNTRATMCIPIIIDSKVQVVSEHRRNSDIYHYSDSVLGYVYVESERILNNISEDSLEECMRISKLLGIIIDKHNIKISSTIDKLTGAFTRKHLEKSIQNQIERSSEVNSQFSLIMFDLDKFKDVNDTFGHRTGDKVLQRVCEVVINNMRQTDLIGRYGGEEFIVILPGTDIEGAKEAAEKIRLKIHQERILGDKRDVTISLGISNYPYHTVVYEELIEKADQALYAAKNSGRNTFKVWNESYSLKGNTTNKLSGILTGSTNGDFRNVSTLIEVVDLVNESNSFEDKIYKILGKVSEIAEAESIGLFMVHEGNIAKTFVRKQFSQNWEALENFNENIIYNAIASGENICSIDWDNISEYDSITVIPEWKSLMVIPLKKGDKVLAVLYLSVSSEVKEFNGDELNFVSTLGKIITTIL